VPENFFRCRLAWWLSPDSCILNNSTFPASQCIFSSRLPDIGFIEQIKIGNTIKKYNSLFNLIVNKILFFLDVLLHIGC